MTLMLAHKNRLGDVVPDMGYVTKYTDQGPYPGNHWFWRDGRKNHGHNRHGLAYLRWTVRPSASSGWRSHGEFTVVRLWVEHREGVLPARLRYANTCGLSQCVNPDHWRRTVAASPWRLHIAPSGMWQLVRTTSAAPALRETVVHLVSEGVVHMVSVAPQTQRKLEPPRAVCGATLVPEISMVTTADLTCSGCS